MKHVFTAGVLIWIFGSTMLLTTALLFTYIDNRHMPLSPLFILPGIITVIGTIITYIGNKYHD